MLEELCKRINHCCVTLRRSRNKKNVGSCWFKSLTGFKLCATIPNNMQQSVQTDATCNIQQCCELLASNRELRQRRRGRQRERHKISKTTTLHVHHTFLYISLPSLHDYDVKLHNFTFCGGRDWHKTTNLFFFSWTLIQFSRIQPPKNSPTFDEMNET